ncbi:hypothetical protein [Candidatus Nephthysia bennettiae]|uniref:DUF4870 domain-containing protein n=1 Tax=Candidatus Nephthysia bennettiae TaxID=3127016 RepID=A0A934NAL2_9BACT|nr:hypothetical protein [Candidatus Dormibacteraeota bacterium]
MQNPPIEPGLGAQTTTPPLDPHAASRKRNRAFYSYILGWLTGLIFLFVEKENMDVKFHAAQSLVFFAATAIIIGVLDSITRLGPGLEFVSWISGFVGLFVFITWIYALCRSWSDGGARFEIPLVKKLVTPASERLASWA